MSASTQWGTILYDIWSATMTPCTPEFVALIKDGVLAIAGAVTACVAILGLRSWQRELHGKANFDAARCLARSTYKLRNEIQAARNPLILGGEFPEGYRDDLGLTKRDPRVEADSYAHV